MCAVEPTTTSAGATSKNNADVKMQALSHQSAAAAELSASPIRRPLVVRRQSSIREASLHATSGSLVSGAVFLFSIYFPFILAPWAASRTYKPAWYQYNADSVFCNSVWTFGTDYLLAAVLATLQSTIRTTRPVSSTLAWRSRCLLASYCLSVLAGGLAHHLYVELPMRNSWHFRLLWTVCVGCVTFASTFMGSIGSELARVDQGLNDLIASRIPVVPEPFWVAFGAFTTVVCAVGGISFQRPACDIFIAGITQFPSTFYMMLLLGVGLPMLPLPNWARIVGVLGFILNAPLLPMYPLLVQYTNWSTASINTLLHAWLLVAWGLQGIALRRVEQALVQFADHPPKAVPIRRNATAQGDKEL